MHSMRRHICLVLSMHTQHSYSRMHSLSPLLFPAEKGLCWAKHRFERIGRGVNSCRGSLLEGAKTLKGRLYFSSANFLIIVFDV